MPPALDTRKAILDAAERLFADLGFEGASLRKITAKAGVNLAAAHYHFGSKEGLLRAALARRIGPLNEERLKLLDEAEADTGKKVLSIESVLTALIAPALRLSRDRKRGGRVFMRLLGRIFNDPGEKLQRLFIEQFEAIGQRFKPALRRALPDLPAVDAMWRLHFVIGVMAHTMADTQKLKFISQGACDPNDTEGIIRQMVAFLAAGMRAPVPTAPQAGKRGGKS
ncbi:MAG: TetR/AcrR family transcriptional regulator [Verrucomicrobiia bacterium]|jgi:AcrR family transcriptional regulator